MESASTKCLSFSVSTVKILLLYNLCALAGRVLLPTILEEHKGNINSILMKALCWCLFQGIVSLNGKRIFALGDKGQLSRYMASKVKEYLHVLQHLLKADNFPLQRWERGVGERGKVVAQGHPAEQNVKLEALGSLVIQPVRWQTSYFMTAEYYLLYLQWSYPISYGAV